jgi:hypothetical protein
MTSCCSCQNAQVTPVPAPAPSGAHNPGFSTSSLPGIILTWEAILEGEVPGQVARLVISCPTSEHGHKNQRMVA